MQIKQVISIELYSLLYPIKRIWDKANKSFKEIYTF